MCTVAPPQVGGSSAPRRHYSTRQRTAETQIIKFKIVDEEPKYKENWNKLKDSDKQNNSENKDHILSSLSSNKPTKRFSFLVRSNSVKQEGTEEEQMKTMVSPSTKGSPGTPHQHHTTNPQKSVTPSDQAILDKLASLNIDTSSSTPAGVTTTMTKTRSRASIYDPPCTRCGEPVYPQERTEPTLRLVFHSSCFKCHHCGVRLTLKTFYRSPLDSKDTRLFCRGHVPALDPGKLDSSRSDHSSLVASSSSSSSSSSGKSSPDCLVTDSHSDTSRTISNNPSMCLQERLEIVKCDTIGLRYF